MSSKVRFICLLSHFIFSYKHTNGIMGVTMPLLCKEVRRYEFQILINPAEARYTVGCFRNIVSETFVTKPQCVLRCFWRNKLLKQSFSNGTMLDLGNIYPTANHNYCLCHVVCPAM